jgi:hypothetical protein
MSTKIGARVLLTLGFLAASVSYSSWIVSRTVLDPSATRGATHALITAPAVRKTLAREIHDTLAPQLGHAAADPKLNPAINAAVADPRFVRAFDDAIAKIHAAILSDKGGRVTLDTRAVTAALRASVAQRDPALARRVRALGTITLPLGSEQLPHIGTATRDVGRVKTLALLLVLALVGGALLLAHDLTTVRRVGRRIAFLAIGPTVVFAVIPRLLDTSHGSAQAVTAALLRAYGRRVLLSAVVLAVIGVSVWLIALATPLLRRLRGSGEAPAPATPPGMPSRMPLRATPIPGSPPAPVPEKLYL